MKLLVTEDEKELSDSTRKYLGTEQFICEANHVQKEFSIAD